MGNQKNISNEDIEQVLSYRKPWVDDEGKIRNKLSQKKIKERMPHLSTYMIGQICRGYKVPSSEN